MTMKTYARIQAGAVAELYETDQDIAELFHPGLTWVECTGGGVAVGNLFVGNAFAAPPLTPPSVEDNQLLARSLLSASDRTVLRCVETAQALPADWKAYRAALRPIAADGEVPAEGWPTQPAYPAS